MARIELYRHAEAAKNHNRNLVGGRSNASPLTVVGDEQADQLGITFSYRKPTFSSVHASPAIRAYNTGIRSLKKAGLSSLIIRNDGLQEISQGLWEGKDRRKPLLLPDGSIEHYIHPYERGLDGKMTGGESVAEVGLRMEDTLRAIAAEQEDTDATVAVFTHDFALRCLRVHLTGELGFIREGVGYCSLTVVELGETALSLGEFGTPQI